MDNGPACFTQELRRRGHPISLRTSQEAISVASAEASATAAACSTWPHRATLRLPADAQLAVLPSQHRDIGLQAGGSAGRVAQREKAGDQHLVRCEHFIGQVTPLEEARPSPLLVTRHQVRVRSEALLAGPEFVNAVPVVAGGNRRAIATLQVRLVPVHEAPGFIDQRRLPACRVSPGFRAGACAADALEQSSSTRARNTPCPRSTAWRGEKPPASENQPGLISPRLCRARP